MNHSSAFTLPSVAVYVEPNVRRLAAAGVLAASVLLVAGAFALGSTLTAHPQPVVPAGVSAAALGRVGLALVSTPENPLCSLHDWGVEHRLAIPVGQCPIAREEAVRDATATSSQKLVTCPRCPMTAMRVAPYQDTATAASLVVETAGPNLRSSGAGTLVWAVSVSRRCTICQGPNVASSPLLMLVDAHTGARLLTVSAR